MKKNKNLFGIVTFLFVTTMLINNFTIYFGSNLQPFLNNTIIGILILFSVLWFLLAYNSYLFNLKEPSQKSLYKYPVLPALIQLIAYVAIVSNYFVFQELYNNKPKTHSWLIIILFILANSSIITLIYSPLIVLQVTQYISLIGYISLILLCYFKQSNSTQPTDSIEPQA